MRPSLLAIAGFAAAVASMAAISSQAWAYDCTGSENKSFTNWDNKAEIRTIVDNLTESKSFDVTIYRNGNEKSNETLDSSKKSMRNTMNVGDILLNDQVNVKIEFVNNDSSGKMTCQYKVTYGSGGGATKDDANKKTTWSLADDEDEVCSDVADLCAGCVMTCENAFIGGARRWRTTFAVGEMLN